MFTKSARFYDAVYGFKDYGAEVDRLLAVIRTYRETPGRTLLDVACGTGRHLLYLQHHFAVEGLDLDAGMLAVARTRFPSVPFHEGDMADFELGRVFDVVCCLFSSIGYTKTETRMRQAVQTMARHVRPGGLLVVEPWLGPDVYRPGRLYAQLVDEPDLKIARMNVSRLDGTVSVLDFHYLVGTPEGVSHFTERHELGLFPHEAYLAAFEAADLATTYDPEGLTGRGLYIGTS